MKCPKCASVNIHRSRHRNRWEAWRKSVFNRRAYRCHDCGWRGWLKSSRDANNVSPHFKFVTYVAVVAAALLAVWMLLPYLE